LCFTQTKEDYNANLSVGNFITVCSMPDSKSPTMAPITSNEDLGGSLSPKSVSRFPKISKPITSNDKDNKLDKFKAKLKKFNTENVDEDVDESPPIPAKEISTVNKGHVRRLAKQHSNIEETTDSPPLTGSLPRPQQGTPLSELAIQLRLLQAKNREHNSVIAQQGIKIRILTDLKGVSLEDMKGALARASESEAHAHMASNIVALEAQVELARAMSSKNKNTGGKAATEARIVGLELQVGELEELQQEDRKIRRDLNKQLRDMAADTRRLELMCAMKDDAIEKATRVPTKMAQEWEEAVKMENLARKAEGRRSYSDNEASLKGILQLMRMKEARQEGVLFEEYPEWGLHRQASEGEDALTESELKSEAAVEGGRGGASTMAQVMPAEMKETRPMEDAKQQPQQDDKTAPAQDAESAARIADLLHQHRSNTVRGSRDGDPADADKAGWAELQAELEEELELEAIAQEESTSADESLREQQLSARLELQESFVDDLQQQIHTLEFLGRAYEHQAKFHETRHTATEEHLIRADKIAGDLLHERGDRVQIEGYLWKLSSPFMTKWERQYFRLIRDHDGILKLLYGEEPGAPSKKYADNIVHRSTNVNTSSKHRGRDNVLRLTVRRRTLYLAADSDPDLERWATTFRRVLNPNPSTMPDVMDSSESGYMPGYMSSKEQEGDGEDEQIALAKCLSLSESFSPTPLVEAQRI